jgi:hypothetical protein
MAALRRFDLVVLTIDEPTPVSGHAGESFEVPGDRIPCGKDEAMILREDAL